MLLNLLASVQWDKVGIVIGIAAGLCKKILESKTGQVGAAPVFGDHGEGRFGPSAPLSRRMPPVTVSPVALLLYAVGAQNATYSLKNALYPPFLWQ